jgi:predicted aspartyl protease
MSFDQSYDYASDEDQAIQVPVLLSANDQSHRVLAKLDTGADFCVFERVWAERLGFDVESGERKIFRTLSGDVWAYAHRVTMETRGIEFESDVYFARDSSVKRNLLGRNGWLDRLRIGIVHYDRKVFLSPYGS